MIMSSTVLKHLVDTYLHELVKFGLFVSYTDIPIVSVQHPREMYIRFGKTDDMPEVISLHALVTIIKTMYADSGSDAEEAEKRVKRDAQRMAKEVHLGGFPWNTLW